MTHQMIVSDSVCFTNLLKGQQQQKNDWIDGRLAVNKILFGQQNYQVAPVHPWKMRPSLLTNSSQLL